MFLIKQLQYILLPLVIAFGCQQSKAETSTISVRVLDENNKPTAARVRFTDMEGLYIAPVGHRVDFPASSTDAQESVEQGAILDGERRFAYIDGQFEIKLPADFIHVEVLKGFNYKIYDDTIAVSKTNGNLEIQMKKWFNMPEDNWYSGDVHVHFIDPKTALLEMKAEDLNVCNVLISDFTIDHERFRGEIEPLSEPNYIVYMGQEYREDRLGHVNLLNIKERLVEPSETMRKHQYPLNMTAIEGVRENHGHASWAHFAAWPGLEGPLAIVLKKIDAIELLCTIDPFHEPIFVSDVVPEVRMNSGLRLWYRLLNCGLKIPITAGTDKMNNQVNVGANRVFAQVENEFTYDNWTDALTDGKTFVSNSPFISFKVDDLGPGSYFDASNDRRLKITAEVWSQLPIDRLEIIVNGELLADKAIAHGKTHAKLEVTYRTKKSVWVAARAYQFSQNYTRKGLSLAQRRDSGGGPTLLNQYFGTLRPETVFAHTSPIYLLVDSQPIKSEVDAAYFVRYLDNSIRWLNESGSFPSEAAKQEVLDAFQEGRQAFVDLGE